MTKKDAAKLHSIEADLTKACRDRTANMLRIGGLLLKAKALVSHGDWGKWLADHFPASERSAENYMRAARLAGKFAEFADLKITKTALIELGADYADDNHSHIAKVVDGLVARAKHTPDRWLNTSDLAAVYAELAPPQGSGSPSPAAAHVTAPRSERIAAPPLQADAGHGGGDVSRAQAWYETIMADAMSADDIDALADMLHDLADKMRGEPSPPLAGRGDADALNSRAVRPELASSVAASM